MHLPALLTVLCLATQAMGGPWTNSCFRVKRRLDGKQSSCVDADSFNQDTGVPPGGDINSGDIQAATHQCTDFIQNHSAELLRDFASAASPANSDGPAPVKCPGVSVSSGKKSLNRRMLSRRESTIAPSPYSCLPLVSKHVSANPYHDLLTGMNANDILARTGQGNGFNIASPTGIKCEQTDRPCTITITRSVTTSSSWMMSVSDALSTSYTSANSTSWGSSNTLTHGDQISSNLERSMQRTKTDELNGSRAKEIQKTIQQTHESATENASTDGTEHQGIGTTTWDRQDYNLLSNEHTDDKTSDSGYDTTRIHDSSSEAGETNQAQAQISVTCEVTKSSADANSVGASASLDIFEIFKVSAEFKHEYTTTTSNGFKLTFEISRLNSKDRKDVNHCSDSTTSYGKVSTLTHDAYNSQTGNILSNGASTALMEGHSQSDTTTTRDADTISQSLLTGSTNTSGWAHSTSDMRGITVGNTVGSNTERSAVDNRNTDLTDTVGRTNDRTVTRDFTKSISVTTGEDQTLNVPGGTCRWVVCRTPVTSVLVPHACTTLDGGIKFYTAELQEVSKSGVTCELQLVACGADLPGFTPNAIRTYSPSNTLPFGQSVPFRIPAGAVDTATTVTIISDISQGQITYRLAFMIATKQIGLFLGNSNVPFWRSGDYVLKDSLLNITETGHLTLWGKGVYQNQDTWTPVWSTQPYIFQQHQVGMNTASTKFKLHIDASLDGELSLIDGNEVLIWSSSRSSTGLGYKYPYSSLYPSVNPTDPNFPRQFDPHNSLPKVMTVIGDTLYNTGCDSVLKESQALQSVNATNGRTFTLYLAPTGNLVLYDGTRLMWESKTADVRYAKGPYRAMFLWDGSFAVKDSRNALIWSTQIPMLTRVYLDGNGNVFGENGDTEALIAKGDKSQHAWGLTWKYNGWTIYDRATVRCDSCHPCLLPNLEFGPMKHLLTGTVLPGNWTYNYVTQKYVDVSKYPGMPLGGNIQWRHYSDGLLSSVNSQDTCLGLNGTTIRCTEGNTVLDKLWSLGPFPMTQLNETNPFLLYGHTMNNVVMYTNGTLQVGGRLVNAPKTPLRYGPAVLRLVQKTMTLEIQNFAGNYTYKYFKPAYTGTKPFTASVENKAPTGIRLVMRDAAGQFIQAL
ncbi:hypothetical protein HDU77_010444 [Chytriomyces hyalinus]|nr:hypothetical protein HDU77_010444 [Chytriomyces hyalinus]